MERTLVDKVFAICDYYLDGKTEKHSRHLYDIHKIYTNMEIPEDFRDLITSVPSLRSELAVCPSAKDGVDITKVLQEIIDTEAYKNDYEEITNGLLFTPLEYHEVITSIKAIIQLNLF